MYQNKQFKEFASKLERYCDYQERCVYDVKNKMTILDVPTNIQDELLEYLMEYSFLNEKRYVNTFVNSKLYGKKWGKRKIFAALRAKHINAIEIENAFEIIDNDKYYEVLRNICISKISSIGNLETNINKKKLLNFALQRGFESSLVWKYISEHKVNNKR